MIDHRLYRTIWRWHFYAGLIVAPFLLILSVTGAIYLFNDEINDLAMPRMMLTPPVRDPLPPSRLIHAALAAHPGSATRIDVPVAPDRPATVYVTPAADEPLRVMVDRASGRVLGSFVYTRTIVGFADTMHGSLTLGPWGDAVVELAACWALVLIGTGLFLWWPRGRRSLAGVLWPRLRARGRLFWRDLHAVAGVWTSGLIVFLLLTGLPWAVVEGPLVRGTFTALNIGNAENGFGHASPQSKPAGEALGRIPWSQQALSMPRSGAHAGHGGISAGPADAAAITGADAVVAKAAARGISDYRLYLPAGPTGTYTILTYPDRPEGQRTLIFDRWSGQVIGQNGWRDYGVGAKAIELGVLIHMGRYFGLANQLLLLVPCLAIILMVLTGVTMWWRRRPRGGGIGAPPAIGGARLRAAAAVLGVASVVLPLFGASLLALVLLDRLAVASRRLLPA